MSCVRRIVRLETSVRYVRCTMQKRIYIFQNNQNETKNEVKKKKLCSMFEGANMYPMQNEWTGWNWNTTIKWNSFSEFANCNWGCSNNLFAMWICSFKINFSDMLQFISLGEFYFRKLQRQTSVLDTVCQSENFQMFEC